jgi:hypothetical protein
MSLRIPRESGARTAGNAGRMWSDFVVRHGVYAPFLRKPDFGKVVSGRQEMHLGCTTQAPFSHAAQSTVCSAALVMAPPASSAACGSGLTIVSERVP